MNREELLKMHEEVCLKARKIMESKNHDYAGEKGEDPFANFRRCESMGVTSAEKGIMVRLCDKLSRVATFLDCGNLKVEDEKVEDSLVDAINYNVLLLGLLRDKKSKMTQPVGYDPGRLPDGPIGYDYERLLTETISWQNVTDNPPPLKEMVVIYVTNGEYKVIGYGAHQKGSPSDYSNWAGILPDVSIAWAGSKTVRVVAWGYVKGPGL